MVSAKRTLFVIGAGCSKNYDCSHNGIAGLTSPTNTDFFTMSRKVLVNSEVRKDTIKPLKNLFLKICEKRGLQHDNSYEFLEDQTLADLEDVMTSVDIDSALFEPRLTIRSQKHPYNVLVELISYTINRTLIGPTCRLHRKLARMMQESDVILDFNYDLLLDNVLRTEKKIDDDSYSVNFFKVYRNGKWERTNSSKQETIDLFKLHGSFNWLKCSECSSILLMQDSISPTRVFSISSLQKFECPRCSSVGVLTRLLLPPIQTKEYHLEPYRFLWSQAAKKLQKIHRIAFLGYSFANTDFATRSLLRRILLYTPMEELSVHFMNPSSDPEERFKKIFRRIKTPTRTENLDQFVKFYKKWH